MAEASNPKPTSNYYRNLGGVNLKASLYELSTAQFLNLVNIDFDTPNALSKRPGSSLYSTQSLSAPVIGLFEFQKLLNPNGQVPADYILANAAGKVFYNTPFAATFSTAFSLLTQNYGATQSVDFLTFANKAWMANGTKWEQWDGATLFVVGLPLQQNMAAFTLPQQVESYLFDANMNSSAAGSYFLVNGATAIHHYPGFSTVARGVYLAYSYNRVDGYGGPADFMQTARNVVFSSPGNGQEFFNSSLHNIIGGFTVPSGYGITSINIWLAEDTINNTDVASQELIPGVGTVPTGALGWGTTTDTIGAAFFASLTLKPGADLNRFWLFTTIPVSSLFGASSTSWGNTFFATTLIPQNNFDYYDGNPPPSYAFSAMSFDLFSSFIPKYMAINQNRMFISGFSSSPSTTWWSEVGAPETYDPTSSFEARTNDGDRIYAIETYNNQLMVMKENSFHKLVGDTSENFVLAEISDQYGCLSNKSVVQYDQKCLWLDKKGILEYNGANNAIISGPIEAVFRRMNVSAAKEYAVGVHNLYRNQLWWGIPVDGSLVNNLTVVYDYLVGAWTFFDGFNPSSFASIHATLDRQTVWRGDYSGFIHFTGESFFNDSGRGISCLIRPRFESSGENNTWIWRRFFLDVATPSGGLTGVLNGRVFSDYDQATVKTTFSMYQNAFQSRAEMGVVGKAVSCEISHYSASLPLLVNGYAWTRRGLRNL